MLLHGALRFSLPALVSGLVLAACGGIPPDGQELSEESLGTRKAALCSGLSVTSLSILGVSSYEGEAAASGSWAVSTFSSGVRLEYYVDGVQRSYDERTGTSGSWYFSATGITCATHTFLVKAFPMVIDSGGNRTVCLESFASQSQSFPDNSCKCVINGLTYNDGRVNPSNSCEICDISKSKTAWSFNSGGYVNTSGFCKQLTNGRRYCVNSQWKNGQACMDNSDCYIACGELL
jgi:hypothetical protein